MTIVVLIITHIVAASFGFAICSLLVVAKAEDEAQEARRRKNHHDEQK